MASDDQARTFCSQCARRLTFADRDEILPASSLTARLALWFARIPRRPLLGHDPGCKYFGTGRVPAPPVRDREGESKLSSDCRVSSGSIS